jgi:SAM-dependent methyltransferase
METIRKQWYEQLFTNYAQQYENEVYTQGTLQEVDFIETEIGHDRSKTILDIGCGTGRHDIELAKRGYQVKGIDLSSNMLDKAREKAGAAHVSVDFQLADARTYRTDHKFDFAIMLCEGGFSLMETDEMNYQILESASLALKPGGKIIFTCLNALFPIFNSVKKKMDESGSGVKFHDTTFDLATFRDANSFEFTDDIGISHQLRASERYYAPSEITWMLRSLGFSKVEIFGGVVGSFSRTTLVSGDTFELLVVATL